MTKILVVPFLLIDGSSEVRFHATLTTLCLLRYSVHCHPRDAVRLNGSVSEEVRLYANMCTWVWVLKWKDKFPESKEPV